MEEQQEEMQEFDGCEIDLRCDRDWVRKVAWELVEARYFRYIADIDPAIERPFEAEAIVAECIKIAAAFLEELSEYEFEDEQIEGGAFDEETKTHEWE